MQCIWPHLRNTAPSYALFCKSTRSTGTERLYSTLFNTACMSTLRHIHTRCTCIKFRSVRANLLTIESNRKIHVSRTCYDVQDRQLRWFDKALVKSNEQIKAVQQIEPDAVESFEEEKARQKRVFLRVVNAYIIREDKNRRGHVDFIHASLAKMEDFGVHRDLEAYKKVADVFPKTVLIPRTMWQIEFMHYPKQQECGMDIMTQMNRNSVLPDQEFAELLCSVFGEHAHVFRKLRRMMYWMPKFRNLNPRQIPLELPRDPIEQAIMALKRMAVDYKNKIDVWKPSSFYMRYTIPAQRQDNFEFETIFESENPKQSKGLVKRLSDHEQPDGTILSMCITGTGTKDSLITWIRYLQKTNPNLGSIRIVFTLRTPQDFIQIYEEDAHEVAKQA